MGDFNPTIHNGHSSEPRKAQDTDFLLLSTSLLVDRVFLHTELVDTLKRRGKVSIWASSYDEKDTDSCWAEVAAGVKTFPHIRAFREIPHNYLRRLNEFVWDYRYLPPSRMSMMEHVRSKRAALPIRALKPPARLLALLQTERRVERNLEKLLLAYPRSNEAEARLRENAPDVIVSTGPFQFEQPAVFAAAKANRL